MVKSITKNTKTNELDVHHKNTKLKNFAKFGFMVIAVITVLFAFSVVCFAATEDGTDLGVKVAGGLENVWAVVQTISLPIAVLAVGAGVISIFAGGERGMERAKKIFIYTAIGVAIIWLAPFLIKSVTTWFKGIGSDAETSIFNGTAF